MLIKKLEKFYLNLKLRKSKSFNVFLKKDYHFPSFDDKYHFELSLKWYLQDINSSVDGGITSKINIIDFLQAVQIDIICKPLMKNKKIQLF